MAVNLKANPPEGDTRSGHTQQMSGKFLGAEKDSVAVVDTNKKREMPGHEAEPDVSQKMSLAMQNALKSFQAYKQSQDRFNQPMQNGLENNQNITVGQQIGRHFQSMVSGELGVKVSESDAMEIAGKSGAVKEQTAMLGAGAFDKLFGANWDIKGGNMQFADMPDGTLVSASPARADGPVEQKSAAL